MSHTVFVTAAFAVTALAMIVLILASYFGMRRSETRADDMRQRP